jgi:hypothetical protein
MPIAGTTLIIAPPADATALHALIPGAGGDATKGFTVPCTTDAVVALTVGGQVKFFFDSLLYSSF